MSKPIKFSIVITTRNRPKLFIKALRSVLNQKYNYFEVIVIVDGSNYFNLRFYKKIEYILSDNVKFKYLPHFKNGHGPSFSRNEGIKLAANEYVLFLDDDDVWTDFEYLEWLNREIDESSPSNLYICQQTAVTKSNENSVGNIWTENIAKSHFESKGKSSGNNVFLEIDSFKLLESLKFPHLNTLCTTKTMIESINYFDERIRYEEDRDFFIRLLFKDPKIFISQRIVAKHFIPEKKTNASQINNVIEKKNIQLRNCLKHLYLSPKKFKIIFALQILYLMKNIQSKDKLNSIFFKISKHIISGLFLIILKTTKRLHCVWKQ